jgi:uncharacterized RDD family membrane protein YckC
MKCPKCGYLGFDSGQRCKNCGYDFSLVEASGAAASRLHPPPASVRDPSLRDPHLARGARYRSSSAMPTGAAVDRPLAAHPEGTPVDLPLFGDEASAPVLPPPRAPLSVRRSTPTPTRIRPRPSTPAIEALTLNLEEPVAEPDPPARTDHGDGGADGPVPRREVDAAASPGRRVAAAAIDLGLIGVVDLVVLHFTLTLCGLSVNDLHVLPVVPMTAFLLVLNGGYIVLFTGTLGQTLGKMAAAIEVVSDRRGGMDLRRAVLRTGATLISLLPAGLGWAAALVGDGRGLHDRLAGTRVIRVVGS